MPPSVPAQSLTTAVRPLRQQATRRCAEFFPHRSQRRFQPRNLSTSTAHRDEVTQSEQLPRWKVTPSRMTAPFRSKPPVHNNEFYVNEDPEKLDRVLKGVLGKGGDKLLTEEAKWLAVTHKSFDHGRRGYNDRLGYLGKRIVEMQLSLALMSKFLTAPPPPPTPDKYGRMPFTHPALDGLGGLTQKAKSMMMEKSRMAQLAARYGLGEVLRWKPKKAKNLQGSGQDLVLSQALYAIIGAVALQHGGEVANRIARERILSVPGSQI